MLENAGTGISVGSREDDLSYFSCDGECYGSVYGSCALASSNARTVAEVCSDPREAHRPFAVIIPYGSGRIACVGAIHIGSAPAYFSISSASVRS